MIRAVSCGVGSISSSIVRGAVRALVRLYYPRIEINDRDRLTATGGVLIVANHANSLIDPVLIGITARRPVHFLAKGPLFDIPIFGKLLRALGMIPAYRASDDSSQVHKNVQSLAEAARGLVDGDAVGIFPEGKSHDLYHIEPVRTGAARIALQAVEMRATTLKLVPVGINYENKERFRSAVWVRVGAEIDVNSWLQQRRDEDPKQSVRALTQEIDSRLQQLVVHLDEPKWERFLPLLETLRPPEADAGDRFARLRQRKRVADAMNYILAHDRPRAEFLASQIEGHRLRLSGAGLDLNSPVLRLRGWQLALNLAGALCRLAVGLPVAVVGTLHHLLPFVLTRLIASRVQAPGRSTVALSRLLIGLPIYAAWYGFVWGWLSFHVATWIATIWIILMPFAGITALHYWEYARRTVIAWWHQIRLLTRRSELGALFLENHELGAELVHLAAEFSDITPTP